MSNTGHSHKVKHVLKNHFICISDPRQWSVEDTCAWLEHYANHYEIAGNITKFLTADGSTLCTYTDQDFIVRIGCPQAGNQIAAQLAMWKNGKSYFNFSEIINNGSFR